MNVKEAQKVGAVEHTLCCLAMALVTKFALALSRLHCASQPQTLSSDESYELMVGTDSCSLTATTVYGGAPHNHNACHAAVYRVSKLPHSLGHVGHTTFPAALRGMQTFSQLITKQTPASRWRQGSTAPGLILANTPWVIKDAPRWNHRGLLVDTSRHFLPLSKLQATVDALAYSKMNVLHWYGV